MNFNNGTTVSTTTLTFPAANKPSYISTGDMTVLSNGKMYAVFAVGGSTSNPTSSKLYEISNYAGTTNPTVTFLTNIPDAISGISYINGALLLTSLKNTCHYFNYNIKTNTVGSSIPYPNNRLPVDNTSIYTSIGSTKRLLKNTTINSNTSDLEYEIHLQNTGNVELTSAQIKENLAGVFGASNISNVVASIVPGGNPSNLSLNATYNGTTNTDLLAAGQGLTNRENFNYVTFKVSLRVTNIDPKKTYHNQAVATGYVGTPTKNVSVTDNTNDGPPSAIYPLGDDIPTAFSYDTDYDGIGDLWDLDDDNDGILDIDEFCSGNNNTNIGGTVGFKDITNSDNGTYPMSGTTVTYVFNESGGANITSLDTGALPKQGPIFKSTASSGGKTGIISQTFGIPLANAKFKMTDFDEGEIVKVEVYDAGGAIIDLSSGIYSTMGTQVQQTGNTFFTTFSNSVDGDNVASDPVGSVLFNFTGVLISKIVTTFTHTAGSSLRFTQPTGFCVLKDTDGDGVPDYLDVDSDGDGCADAIEGSENVTASQIYPLNLPATDPNYHLRGQIKVIYDGTTANTPPNIISKTPAALGVPQLVNNAGNNLNTVSNPSNLAGVADNTDGTVDIGQGIGISTDPTKSACFIDAVNDINQVPQGVTATGSVLTNDESLSNPITVQSATYLNSSGVVTPLPLGTATNVYDASGILAGSMTLNANGSYTFVPTSTYVGTVPVNYVAVNSVGITDPAQLTIVVIKTPITSGNDNPIAQNDTGYTELNTPVSSNVLVNDSDPDGNPLTVTGATQGGITIPVGTSTTVSGVNAAGVAVPNAGTVTLNANGTYTYTPATGFVGTVNPIPYTISDGQGGTATAVLNLSVLPDFGNNTFGNDDANSGVQGTTLTGNILTNDTDPEGNSQTVTGATAGGTAITIGTATSIPGVGSLTLNANGTYTFVPLATYTGTTSVVYTVCDNGAPQACDTATLYLTELPNTFIDAVNDINQIPQGVTATGNVLTNDETATGYTPITVQSATYLNSSGVVTPLPLGTATNVYDASGILAGSMTLNANGTYTFVPTSTYVGTVPVNYVAVNSAGSTDPAELTIVVIKTPSGTNNSPIAQNDTGYTELNTPVTSNVLVNDSDPDGNPLTVTGATQGGITIPVGTSTTVSGVNAAGVAVPNAGTVTLNANGTYTYTPATGFVGTVNPIPYTISDGQGGTATAVLNLSVLPNYGNNTFGNDDANTGILGTTLTGNILTNDTDPEGNSQTVTGATAGGTAITIGTATSIPGVGSLTLNANGTYTFVPLATYTGTTSVVYTVCDNGTPQACDTATLYLTLIPLGVCYENPNTGAGVATKHGITLLQRAGADNGNWPMIRTSAHTVLESNTKGFVITRMTPTQISGLTGQEGMMVYDTVNKCLKIYSDGAWSCFETPTCP